MSLESGCSLTLRGEVGNRCPRCNELCVAPLGSVILELQLFIVRVLPCARELVFAVMHMQGKPSGDLTSPPASGAEID